MGMCSNADGFKAPQSGPSESLRQRQNQSHSVQIHGLQINTQIFNVFSK